MKFKPTATDKLIVALSIVRTNGARPKQKMNWKPINTIPQELMDGRLVMLKRVYQGRVISGGPGRYDSMSANAPSRRPIWTPPWSPGLNETQADRDRESDQKRWVLPDRMYLFPTPTHWKEYDGQ